MDILMKARDFLRTYKIEESEHESEFSSRQKMLIKYFMAQFATTYDNAEKERVDSNIFGEPTFT